MIYFKRLFFTFIFTILSFYIYWNIFYSIYFSDNIVIIFAIHPFNICEEQPYIWNIIKFSSIFFYITIWQNKFNQNANDTYSRNRQNPR